MPMKPCCTVFERIEKKYGLTPIQYQFLQEALAPYMKPDEYGESTVCSVYFDTEQYDLIRRSIEKPSYKEKFRVRSYGVPSENSPVFWKSKRSIKKSSTSVGRFSRSWMHAAIWNRVFILKRIPRSCGRLIIFFSSIIRFPKSIWHMIG